ncbi:MAG: SO2930 family diheme c-type cytochrome [Flammeovirgaceae bacterium]
MKWIVLFVFLALLGCQPKPSKVMVIEEGTIDTLDVSSIGLPKLSDYHFFKGDLKNLEPTDEVHPYALNSALFSDYAFKRRFAFVTKGKTVQYQATDVLEFPEGTVLIKNFYYPSDFRQPEKEKRILETRLLLLENGSWKALPYIWKDDQTEAYLDVAGKSVAVHWSHYNGEPREVDYSIPNMNQCKGCHLRGDRVMPIGPSARQLNHAIEGKNVLVNWASTGLLKGLPAIESVPRLASYDDEQQPVAERARAWLEINCAHCHRADGPAKTSGLHLLADVADANVLGVGKAPIAAGKGSGGRLFGIVPGKPDQSILQYRIESTHPGIMMPELGRKMVHEEGVALVRQWILGMGD